MHNTGGNLTEHILAKKLARDLEDRELLPAKPRGLQSRKMRIGYTAVFTFDVYESPKGKESHEATLCG